MGLEVLLPTFIEQTLEVPLSYPSSSKKKRLLWSEHNIDSHEKCESNYDGAFSREGRSSVFFFLSCPFCGRYLFQYSNLRTPPATTWTVGTLSILHLPPHLPRFSSIRVVVHILAHSIIYSSSSVEIGPVMLYRRVELHGPHLPPLTKHSTHTLTIHNAVEMVIVC